MRPEFIAECLVRLSKAEDELRSICKWELPLEDIEKAKKAADLIQSLIQQIWKRREV